MELTVGCNTRPHCNRCGRYLDRRPDNAYGWCEACEVAARYGGLPLNPLPQPVVVPQAPRPYPQPWTPWTPSVGPWFTCDVPPSYPTHIGPPVASIPSVAVYLN